MTTDVGYGVYSTSVVFVSILWMMYKVYCYKFQVTHLSKGVY